MASEIGLLLGIIVMSYVLYQHVDFFTTFAKHQMAEQTMNQYLTKMRIEGRLLNTHVTEIQSKFSSFGCVIDSPDTDIVANAKQSTGGCVLKNDGFVQLQITCRPVPEAMPYGKLIGGNNGGSAFRIKVGGADLSEKISPCS